MKKRVLISTLFIILGLLIAIGPSTLFPVCDPMENGSFMKCHWTERAELGIGLGIVLLSVLTIVFASKQIRAGISIGIAVLSVIAALVPTLLIGVCGGEHMRCNALTRPALLVLGIISAIFAIIYSYKLLRSKESE